jgi:hypothetical protein
MSLHHSKQLLKNSSSSYILCWNYWQNCTLRSGWSSFMASNNLGIRNFPISTFQNVDLLLSASCTLYFEDFCGDRVNCSSIRAEEAGLRRGKFPRYLSAHIMHYTIGLRFVTSANSFDRVGGWVPNSWSHYVCTLQTFFNFPVSLQNYLALLKRQPFQRHFLWLYCHSIRWLWHSCDYHQSLREYCTTRHTLHFDSTLKISINKLCYIRMHLFSPYVYNTSIYKTMANVQHWARESIVVEALCYKLEGREFGTPMGWMVFNLPNFNSRTRPWGFISL